VPTSNKDSKPKFYTRETANICPSRNRKLLAQIVRALKKSEVFGLPGRSEFLKVNFPYHPPGPAAKC